MKITPLTIDFDVTNEQEVAFVNDLPIVTGKQIGRAHV